MSSILYAWEFGANLGHVGAFMPLAKALRDHGHTVHWGVTQAATVGDYLASEGFSWLAAPSLPEQPRQGPPLSYADILLRFGYADPKALFGLTGAWRELMRLTGARLVLTDHAPTAVLAARTLGLPVMMFSNGFTVPPMVNPLPNMRPWQPMPGQQLQAIDDTARNTVNQVLARHGLPAISCTAQLFDVAEETLITFPELDHYADRGPARYWGSLPSAGTGFHADWPAAQSTHSGPKIFAYLRRETPHHERMLEAIAATPCSALLYFPDIDPALRERYARPHLRFLDRPADIGQMTREADLAITYSSLATTTAFLLAGKPILLLPGHLEQFLLARRVVEMGAGILVNPEQPETELKGLITALIQESGYRANAEAFARKYAAFEQQNVLDNLVRRIEELSA